MSSPQPETGIPAEPISLAEFLEAIPPTQVRLISDPMQLLEPVQRGQAARFNFKLPSLQLHCPSAICNGMRVFRPAKQLENMIQRPRVDLFLSFVCANCGEKMKTYAVAVYPEGLWRCLKLGEIPTFGPPLPERISKLIGGDRENFFAGRRCENQGLGIGAFAYCRRVVENQKNRIIDEIIAVAQRTRAAPEIIDSLNHARQETQFTKALESVKVPDSLLLGGHNPLLLLHGALSDGLHARSDEECLEVATDVRRVLVELAEQIAEALKDDAALQTSLQRLAARRGNSEGKSLSPSPSGSNTSPGQTK